jgi:hypothetical protein
MIQLSTRYAFDNLRVVGLATDRCYVIDGSLVRVYFRLSNPPPAGWSYLFSTIWQEGHFSLKRFAGVDGDAIWMDCVPEEIKPEDLKRLGKAVAQANDEYRAKAREQALSAERRGEIEARLHAQLAEWDRVLSSEKREARQPLGLGAWLAKLRSLFKRVKA